MLRLPKPIAQVNNQIHLALCSVEGKLEIGRDQLLK